MTTPIPLRLAQRKRELEDLIETHKASARSAGDLLAGINEAIQAYDDQAAEHAAIARLEPVTEPATERTRAPRRDIRGMVLEFLREQGPHNVAELAAVLEITQKRVVAVIDHLHSHDLIDYEGPPTGNWKVVTAEPQPLPIALPSDDTADHGREPTLALAQDAAA